MIVVKFDDSKVVDEEIVTLSKALKDIVVKATGISEVFVYADSPRIKIDVAPIEVFVEMSAHKINDVSVLFENVKNQLSSWKKENNFTHPVTMTITPMNWKFEVGI